MWAARGICILGVSPAQKPGKSPRWGKLNIFFGKIGIKSHSFTPKMIILMSKMLLFQVSGRARAWDFLVEL